MNTELIAAIVITVAVFLGIASVVADHYDKPILSAIFIILVALFAILLFVGALIALWIRALN